MRFIPSGFTTLLFFVLLMAFSLGNAPVFEDPDTARHIAAGDFILAWRSIPFSDPYAFTASHEVWYNFSWLFDVFFSLLFRAAGFSGIYAVTLIAFAASIVFMANHCIVRGGNRVIVFATALLALYVMQAGIIARPNIASVLLTVAFYCLAQRYRTTGKGLCLAALPPLMALWVNLHPAFMIGFLLLLCFLIEAATQGRRRAAGFYGAAIAACLAATLINPYGFGVYWGAFSVLRSPFDQVYLNEWLPVKIGHVVPMTLLLAAMLGLADMRDARVPLVDRIFSVVLLVMALSSARHMPVAALLLMPYIALRASHMAEGTVTGARLLEWNGTVARDMQKPDIRIMGAVFAAAALLFICLPFPRDAVLRTPAGFPAASFPAKEAEYVKLHYPELRFLNDYDFGGYLIYAWRGTPKVFVDGRASSLYSPEVLMDYVDFTHAHGFGANAERIARQYRLDGLIVSNGSKGAEDWRWNPQWKTVYSGPVATVYLRATKPPALTPHSAKD